MKKLILRFTLYAVMVYLAGNTLNPAVAASEASDEDDVHFCGVTDDFLTNQHSNQSHNRRYARTLSSNLNVGEPRTVRMIYFLPKDREYHAATVRQMKNEIHKVQTFYAQQMKSHGYGLGTFSVEIDPQGEPVVHRVDGEHPESHYLNDAVSTVVSESEREFNLDANIYVIVLDNSSGSIGARSSRIGGVGFRRGKHGGYAMVPAPFNESSTHVMAHEIGHAFGLYHDFTNPVYLMSYGERSQSRLSSCHAEFLAVHPYFNPDVEALEGSPPTIELISPTNYPAGATSVPVRLKLSDPEGLHQVLLLRGLFYEVWGCRGLADTKDLTVEFDYDGYSGEAADWANVIGLADFETHVLTVIAVDKHGNLSSERFELSEAKGPQARPQTLEKISGDNQQGRAYAQLAQPLVVEVRDQNRMPLPDAHVTFAVVAGEGRLSGQFALENATTDANGRAERTLTVGAGRTIVEVSIRDEGITQTRAIFNAIGVGAPTVSIMNGDYQRWHLPDGATMRLGKGRIGESDRAVAFSPEGQLLAVASGIGVWLYDVTTARELALLPSTRSIHSVAFSTNGKTLAAGVERGVILWDVMAQTQITSLDIPFTDGRIIITSVSFSSDEETIAFMSHLPDAVKLWHVPSGNVTTLVDNDGRERRTIIRPQSVSFSPDGRMLAAGSSDGIVELWDVGTQRLLAALPGHRHRVTSVAFSRDGKTLASGSIDETVRLWNVMKRENIAILRGHRRWVNSVAFSPDGTRLASGAYGRGRDATIKLWDIASEQNINTFTVPREGVYAVAFSTDGRTIASGSRDGTVKLWDVETGNVEFAISGHTSVDKSVSFSPDGSTLATGSRDGTVKLWDVTTGRHVETFGSHALGVSAVAFSPDGALLASGSYDSTTKLWDVETGTAVSSRFTYYCKGLVNSVAFSPDGTIVATGDARALILWNSATGEEISTPFGYASFVSSVAFSPEPDSSLVAFGSDFGVKLWDVATHTPIATLGETSKVISVAFSPDGSVLASGGGWDHPVTLWNVLTGKKIGTLAMYIHGGDVTSLLFSPNGAIFASAGADNTIKLWDVPTLRSLTILGGHNGGGPFGITSLSFSDDMVLASGSDGDGTVLLWDLSELVLSGPELADENIETPKTLDIISGDNQEGLPSSLLENPFVVEVRDQSGEPLPGVQVTFVVSSGGGTLGATTATTDSDGRAESTLTLGPNPGTNTVEATVTGIEAERTFSAEGIGTPKTSEIFSGANQEGLPSSALENPFVVEVRDQSGEPLPGVQVTFVVSSGGGTLGATTATTDSDGRAESTLTLGPNPGTNTVEATVTGIEAKQTFSAEGIRTPKAFWIISGFDQKGLIGEALPRPIVIEVRGHSGEPLPNVQVTFTVTNGGGTLSVTSTTTDSDGRAESTLTLGPDQGTNTVDVAVSGIRQRQTATAIAELPPILEDVNMDDVVNILDLVLVASDLGAEDVDLAADVNVDGVVNILDLVLVAGALGNAAAAPSSDSPALSMLTATGVEEWLAHAQGVGLTDTTSRRGVLFLEQLLAALTPEETKLLANYPNPFNPETWIPYRLAEDTFVTLTIYDSSGRVVRALVSGHQAAAFYESRTEAIYWDGRNDFGEGVTSGVYFYRLSAGDFSATRKMLILK